MKNLKFILVAVLATITIILTGSVNAAYDQSEWEYNASDNYHYYVADLPSGQSDFRMYIEAPDVAKLYYQINSQGDWHLVEPDFDNKIELMVGYNEQERLSYVELEQGYIDSWTTTSNNYVSFRYRMPGKPAINGKNDVINNVSSPFTLEQLKKITIVAVTDEYDGNISLDKVQVIRDTWSANKNVPGVYEVEYQVTNSAGLSSTFVSRVLNQDFDAPILTGPTTETISYTRKMSIEEITAKFTVTDNIDKDLVAIVENHNYVANTVGEYTFTILAKDTAGNITRVQYVLNVIDDVAPIITDETSGVIQFNFKEPITDAKLLLGLTAIDAVDGNITSKIKVVNNPINPVLGKYIVKYEVSDNAGNITLFEREYEIITTSAPQFWLSEKLISIEDVNTMSIDQLAMIFASYEKIDVQSYEIITNEYFGNETTTGQYLLSMKIVDKDNTEHLIERTINVFNKSDLPTEPETPVKKTIWQIIVDVLTWILNNILLPIWKGISWLWKHTIGALFKLITK